jgi:GNAT superfamily N-acetyltransferase
MSGSNGTGAIVLRALRVEDRAEVERMVRGLLAETIHGRVHGRNPDAIMGHFDRFVNDNEIYHAIIADCAGCPVGIIGVVMVPNMVSGEPMGAGVIWWADRHVRHARVGLKLLHAAEIWVQAHGAKLMQFGSWHERRDEFYARLGYQPMERVWQKTF